YREEELRSLLHPGTTLEAVKALPFHKGRGCETCSGTGYRGRAGLFEVMAMSPEIRRMVLRGASVAEIRDRAVEEGTLTLRMDGIKKIEKGVTTLEEVVKETSA
ncbi:MAG: type II secretion system protein GspE, partial [Candidatus Rokuibacteriota bacterium]